MSTLLVPDVLPRRQYVADGVNKVYAYPFPIFLEEDLKVYETPPNQVPNPATDILPSSAYTVSGVGSTTGGNVTITALPAADSIITIERDVPIDRTTDYTPGGEFTAESINGALDRLTMICQQLESLIVNRGVTYLVTEQLEAGDTTLPKLLPNANDGKIPMWTKNSAGALVAALLDENPDASTLRSELADETLLGQGSALVGYNNTSMGGPQTVRAALDTIVADIETIENEINNILPVIDGIPTTGDITFSIATSKTGWVHMNDGSIGNASSGATTRANADTQALFVLMWNNIIDTYAPVSGGRGASALDDFNANKTMTLPKTLGRALASAGAGAGLSARGLAQDDIGTETHLLTEPELAEHLHGAPFGSFVTNAPHTSGPGAPEGDSATLVQVDTGTAIAGQNIPHNNMQPSVFFNVFIKL